MSSKLPLEFDVSVEDLLNMPEIQQLLTADSSLEATSTSTTYDPDFGCSVVQESKNDSERSKAVEKDDDEKRQQESYHLSSSQEIPSASAEAASFKESRVPWEPDGFVHKTQPHSAKLGYSMLQKDEDDRQLKLRIADLEAELARLQQVETESTVYEQQSLTSLRAELDMLKAEVADLSQQLTEAENTEIEMRSKAREERRK